MTIRQFKAVALKELSSSPSPALDIDVLLCFSLNCTKTHLLLHYNEELPLENLLWLEKAVEKRKTGLPVAYITGHKEFYGYDFIVSPSVLIPKPDTEILTARAIDVITDVILKRPSSVLTVCDMCTGSGCIALSVLKSLIDEPAVPRELIPAFTLVDISAEALSVARENARHLIPDEYLERVRFIQSNLFEEVPFLFNVILTNPPYVPAQMAAELLEDGRNEPLLALDGDAGADGEPASSCDGLSVIRRLLPECAGHLVYGGSLLMETGEYNAEAAAGLAKECGFKGVNILRDLENQLRVVECHCQSLH